MQPLVSGYGLLEAARWYPEQGLLFSDMTRGGVYRLPKPDADPEPVLPHRKGIGGLVAHRDGGLVVAGRNVARKGATGAEGAVLEKRADEQFFNDLTADLAGRLYVGSVALDPPEGVERGLGRLYRVGVDGAVDVLADDVTVSNGLGVSPGGALLYHVDTHRRTIWAFDLDSGDRRTFATTDGYPGVPDGLAVADDGSVWVALAGGSLVVGWDAGGRRVGEIGLPQSLVTSLTFGEPGTLYVLTGADDQHPDPLGGCVYAVPTDRRGLPGPLAAVPVLTPGDSR